MITLYLIRHGETDGNAKDLAQGHYDEPLNEQGRAQAQLLAKRLRPWRIDSVHSSDSARSVQTIEPLLALRPDLELQTTPALREKFYGECENLAWHDLRVQHSNIFKKLLNPRIGSDVRFPGGETDREHMHRVADFTSEILRNTDADANVLIVSHGGSIKAAAAYMCQMRMEDKWRLRTDNTSINSLIDEPTWRDDAWQIASWNDIYHLNGSLHSV